MSSKSWCGLRPPELSTWSGEPPSSCRRRSESVSTTEPVAPLSPVSPISTSKTTSLHRADSDGDGADDGELSSTPLPSSAPSNNERRSMEMVDAVTGSSIARREQVWKNQLVECRRFEKRHQTREKAILDARTRLRRQSSLDQYQAQVQIDLAAAGDGREDERQQFRRVVRAQRAQSASRRRLGRLRDELTARHNLVERHVLNIDHKSQKAYQAATTREQVERWREQAQLRSDELRALRMLYNAERQMKITDNRAQRAEEVRGMRETAKEEDGVRHMVHTSKRSLAKYLKACREELTAPEPNERVAGVVMSFGHTLGQFSALLDDARRQGQALTAGGFAEFLASPKRRQLLEESASGSASASGDDDDAGSADAAGSQLRDGTLLPRLAAAMPPRPLVAAVRPSPRRPWQEQRGTLEPARSYDAGGGSSARPSKESVGEAESSTMLVALSSFRRMRPMPLIEEDGW